MLGAVKPASMKCPAVFDPRAAATLLAIVGGALSGDAVVRGRSFFADRVGETVAAPLFTLLDDPTDPRHFAASSHDGEGLACRQNVLIRDGRLEGFVYDTYSARRAGTASTGSALRGGIAGSPWAGCRALQLLPGDLDQAAILREVGFGVYVESMMGVHSGVNPVSGDFSVGVTGHMIEMASSPSRCARSPSPRRCSACCSTSSYVGNDVRVAAGHRCRSDPRYRPNVAVSGA